MVYGPYARAYRSAAAQRSAARCTIACSSWARPALRSPGPERRARVRMSRTVFRSFRSSPAHSRPSTPPPPACVRRLQYAAPMDDNVCVRRLHVFPRSHPLSDRRPPSGPRFVACPVGHHARGLHRWRLPPLDRLRLQLLSPCPHHRRLRPLQRHCLRFVPLSRQLHKGRHLLLLQWRHLPPSLLPNPSFRLHQPLALSPPRCQCRIPSTMARQPCPQRCLCRRLRPCRRLRRVKHSVPRPTSSSTGSSAVGRHARPCSAAPKGAKWPQHIVSPSSQAARCRLLGVATQSQHLSAHAKPRRPRATSGLFRSGAHARSRVVLQPGTGNALLSNAASAVSAS